jgi:cytochrome c553
VIVTITWRRVLVVGAAMAALGLAVAWSGVVNIGASTGHSAITDWFLHWAMRNTVRTYAALTVDEPAADATSLVAAAGHYAANCAQCHGAPGEQASPVMRSATPPAPDLARTVPTWSDGQLFWIIKHGVKFTAMPAWPAQDRDDEVRRMTAFVRRLPAMAADDYRALAYGQGKIAGGELTELDAAVADCDRCHAENGREQADIPVLAGQKAGYLAATLDAYAAGRRPSGVMSAAAAKVDGALRSSLARHYAGSSGGVVERELTTTVGASGLERVAADVVANGIPELNLPACADCHGPGTRERYPLLAGQKPTYLASRLRLWRADPNVVDARKTTATMPVIARRIPEHLIEPLAAYFAAR